MKRSLFSRSALALFSFVLLLPSLARADEGGVTVVDGKFADHFVEGRPTTITQSAACGGSATSFLTFYDDVASTLCE
jgi:hypothetical protein